MAALFVLALLAAAAWALPAGPAHAQQGSEDLVEVTVEFSFRSDHVVEGSSDRIWVRVSDFPDRELEIPITATPLGGASEDDYDVPLSVTFGPDDRSAFVTFEATDDADDDGEYVRLGFGSPLPPGVSLGSSDFQTTIVQIVDGGIVAVGLAQVGVGVTAHVRDNRVVSYQTSNGVISSDRRRSTIANEAWQWQRSATRDGVYTDVPAADGGTLKSYIPSPGDLSMWIKAKVTYDVTFDPDREVTSGFGLGSQEDSIDPDLDNNITFIGQTAQAVSVLPVLSSPAVSNAGLAHHDDLIYGYSAPPRHSFAQAFTSGADPRGYLLVGVRVDLEEDSTSGGDTASGTWSVWEDNGGKPAVALAPPLPLPHIDGRSGAFEELRIPRGLRLQPGAKYWIVISDTNADDDVDLFISTLAEYSGNYREISLEGLLEVDPQEWPGRHGQSTFQTKTAPNTTYRRLQRIRAVKLGGRWIGRH